MSTWKGKPVFNKNLNSAKNNCCGKEEDVRTSYIPHFSFAFTQNVEEKKQKRQVKFCSVCAVWKKLTSLISTCGRNHWHWRGRLFSYITTRFLMLTHWGFFRMAGPSLQKQHNQTFAIFITFWLLKTIKPPSPPVSQSTSHSRNISERAEVGK